MQEKVLNRVIIHRLKKYLSACRHLVMFSHSLYCLYVTGQLMRE